MVTGRYDDSSYVKPYVRGQMRLASTYWQKQDGPEIQMTVCAVQYRNVLRELLGESVKCGFIGLHGRFIGAVLYSAYFHLLTLEGHRSIY